MRRHVPTILVLALLVGTAVAFAETERLKLKPTPILESFVAPAFSPACECPQSRAEIRLRLHRADAVTVRVLDADGDVVDVVANGRELPRGRSTLYWNGHGEPDGRYRFEAELAAADRTFTLPRATVLDTVAPSARVVSYPDAVEAGQKVRVVYRLSEPAHGVLYVNGQRVIRTYTKLRSAQLNWHPQRPGSYRLQLAALDLAGNLGPRSPEFVVTAG